MKALVLEFPKIVLDVLVCSRLKGLKYCFEEPGFFSWCQEINSLSFQEGFLRTPVS